MNGQRITITMNVWPLSVVSAEVSAHVVILFMMSISTFKWSHASPSFPIQSYILNGQSTTQRSKEALALC